MDTFNAQSRFKSRLFAIFKDRLSSCTYLVRRCCCTGAAEAQARKQMSFTFTALSIFSRAACSTFASCLSFLYYTELISIVFPAIDLTSPATGPEGYCNSIKWKHCRKYPASRCRKFFRQMRTDPVTSSWSARHALHCTPNPWNCC